MATEKKNCFAELDALLARQETKPLMVLVNEATAEKMRNTNGPALEEPTEAENTSGIIGRYQGVRVCVEERVPNGEIWVAKLKVTAASAAE